MAAVVNTSQKGTALGADNVSTGSMTIGGVNRTLYVLVLASAGTPLVPDAVKWGGAGGTAMTQIGTTITLPSFWKISLWRLIGPAATTSTAYAHFASSIDELGIIAVAMEDSDQTTPNGTVAENQSTGTGITATATCAVGDTVLGFGFFGDQNGNNFTLLAGQTSLQEIEGATLSFEGLGAEWTTAAGTTQAMTWTISGTPAGGGWGAYALAVKPVSAPASPNHYSDVATTRARPGRGPFSLGKFFVPSINASTDIAPVILSVSDATHGHTVDSPELSQADALTVNDATHAHTVDSPSLTQAAALTIADALHAHTVDSPDLSQAGALTVNDALHAHTVDSVTLPDGTLLDVADALHSHAVDSPSLSQASALTVNDATHSHTVDSPSLSQASALTVADTLHGHAVDSVTLLEGDSLDIDDALHGHSVDSPTLSQASTLTVSDALHTHRADGVSLRPPGSALDSSVLFSIEADAPRSFVLESDRSARLFVV